MFGDLGFRVINTDTSSKREFKVGYGLTLTSVSVYLPDPLFGYRYIYPICTSVEIYTEEGLSE